MYITFVIIAFLISTPLTYVEAYALCSSGESRHLLPKRKHLVTTCLHAASSKPKGEFGGGGGGGFGSGKSKQPPTTKIIKKNRLQNAFNDTSKLESQYPPGPRPYFKVEQSQLLEELSRKSGSSTIGRAVADFLPIDDPFWELMPSLICSRFPNVQDKELERIAGFVRHTLHTITKGSSPRPVDWVDIEYRPFNELHAYMPDLGPTQPFHNPAALSFCQMLESNFEIIRQEYETLLNNNMQDRFQSVTSMNYEAGWKTLVLFYNGHRIPNFPYHLCPTTTRILETVPLAGRIAGFNRQQPQSGIPRHTDSNNMWLTTQMGIFVPENQLAHICVGSETRHWQEGKCLLYDTTYEHETWNAHPTQERVVLHVDFFNTFAMTPIEIEVMQYVYSMREQFMKAEGIAKVGAQIL